MKLRYLFTALLFTGAAAPLQAQSIDHMRKLLQEIQQEIDCLEKEQAETLKPRKEPQPVESTEYVDGVIAVDTLPSGNDAVMIVLFNDNTWKYLRNRVAAFRPRAYRRAVRHGRRRAGGQDHENHAQGRLRFCNAGDGYPSVERLRQDG